MDTQSALRVSEAAEQIRVRAPIKINMRAIHARRRPILYTSPFGVAANGCT